MQGLLQIQLMGHYSVLYNNQPLTTLDADRIRSLLTWLVLNRGKPVRRQEVAFQLWPDTSEDQARTNLRNLLHQLRTALPEPDRYLETTRHTLVWRETGPYTLDIAPFEQALCEAQQLQAGPSRHQALERAVRLYGGELLPGVYDEWLEPYREKLQTGYIQAVHSLMTSAEAAGAWQTALQWAEHIRQHDPLNEHGYVHLMRLHARSGNPQGVEHVYQTCVQTLQQELRVEPSSSTQASYAEWRTFVAHETAPQMLSPGVNPLNKRRFPTLATPLIGRSTELAHISTMLQDPHCRLLTIVGPGGVGKTSLALALAEHIDHFRAGSSFISLVALESSTQLLSALAEELDLVADQQRTMTQQIITELREQQRLLIFDNAEHLLDDLSIVSEILAQTTAIKVVVTSRERLNMRDEWVFNLAGLVVPIANEQHELNSYGAVQLFIQRAQQIEHDFTLTPDNQHAVTEICRLVEGSPLALELAAAWIRLLTPAEIAQEITANLDFLASEARDLPLRHRSLRAVFEHSWQLLSPDERRCLARLSVFRGTFTRQAAEAIAQTSLMLLGSFVDKSLIQRETDRRYQLHPLIRQYAAQQFQTTPEDQQHTEERFISYYADLLADWKQALHQSRDRQTLHAIQREIDNIRQWLHWALAFQRHAALLQGCETLALFYETSGWFREGEQVFGDCARQLALLESTRQWPSMTSHQHDLAQQALCLMLAKQAIFEQLIGDIQALRKTLDTLTAQAERAGLTAWKSEVLRIWGSALRYLGSNPQECQQVLEQAIHSYQASGDLVNTIRSMFVLADFHVHHAQMEAALEYLQQALELNRVHNNQYLQALLISELGVVYIYQQKQHESIHHFKHALELFRGMDDALGILRTANNLGMMYNIMGYPQDGLVYLQEALSYGQRCQSLTDQACVLDSLAAAYFDLDRYAEARDYWQETLRFSHKIGWLQGLGWACSGLGRIALKLGAYDEAQTYLQQAIGHMQASGEPREIARCIGELGVYYQQVGADEEALKHYDQAIAQLQELHVLPQAAACMIQRASLLEAQNRWQAAYADINSCIQIIEHIEQPALLWEALLLEAKLCYKHRDQTQGWQKMLNLLQQATSVKERAAALYLIWIVKHDEQAGNAAYQLYQTLYAETSAMLYRERLAELEQTYNVLSQA